MEIRGSRIGRYGTQSAVTLAPVGLFLQRRSACQAADMGRRSGKTLQTSTAFATAIAASTGVKISTFDPGARMATIKAYRACASAALPPPKIGMQRSAIAERPEEPIAWVGPHKLESVTRSSTCASLRAASSSFGHGKRCSCMPRVFAAELPSC
jgi:hypothetical protein